MIAGCWFSFSPDWLCLRESVLQFREVFPGAPVCIFDDAAHATPLELLRELKPDLLEITDWKRVANIQGWEAVNGILKGCMRAVEVTGAAGTLKIDCDTLVLKSEWIDESNALDGWDGGQGRFAVGMARYLRADVPGRLIDSLASRFLWSQRVPEDQAISFEALWEFAGECRLHSMRPSGEGPRAGAWHYSEEVAGREPTFHPLASLSALTFGNRSQITQVKKPCERREWAGMKMRSVREMLACSPNSG